MGNVLPQPTIGVSIPTAFQPSEQAIHHNADAGKHQVPTPGPTRQVRPGETAGADNDNSQGRTKTTLATCEV